MSGEESTTTEQNDLNNNQNKTNKCFKVSVVNIRGYYDRGKNVVNLSCKHGTLPH